MENAQVLILEDDEDLRNLLMTIIETAGYTAVGFDDGADALVHLSGAEPHAIVLDMLMPHAKVDGFAFLARLSGTSSSAIPVVIMSGLSNEISEALAPDVAKTLRIAAILPKPVAYTALIEELKRVIRPGKPQPEYN
jgi:DNA-binding NtrC family response regulator